MDPTDESPLDQPESSDMFDGLDTSARLDTVERRLAAHAAATPTAGLTEPDEGGDERWEEGQVWAHLAEFVPYWDEQLEGVIAAYDGTAVPFGRTKSDVGRITAIEMGRHEDIALQMSRTHEAIERLRRYLDGLTTAEWNAVGLHPTLGEMDVEAIVERFLIRHLEEHADQLDGLRSEH
jgi:hypothetical protein